MKLLVITQKVDKQDPVLGFFHNWLAALSKRTEKLSVICLEKGEYDLPNVKVYSLGKECKRSRLKYITNFYNYIVGLNKEYDAVLVHMNQEYVLLGGLFWKLLGKKIYFWRNHPHGNLLTRIAVWFSDKVFCTSSHSYTAKFKKADLMPVGIDTDLFYPQSDIVRQENSILFLSRMSSIKRPELLIEALRLLKEKGTSFTASFYGDPLPADHSYYLGLKEAAERCGLLKQVIFHHAIPNEETRSVYSAHRLYVNLTPSGSLDKTILEAAACGCLPIVVNQSLREELPEGFIVEAEPAAIAATIERWLKEKEVEGVVHRLQELVLQKHSLSALMEKLCIAIKE